MKYKLCHIIVKDVTKSKHSLNLSFLCAAGRGFASTKLSVGKEVEPVKSKTKSVIFFSFLILVP
jgi:hypothetical protein